jgi:superfamily II DNA or RNA helicase
VVSVGDTISLSRWDQAPYVFLGDDTPREVIDALDDELSYPVQDAERTDAYKRGDWDGFERLLRESSNGNHYFPLGCLSRAVSVVRGLGHDPDVKGIERNGRGDLDLAWNTDMTLRDYQQEAVTDALRRGNGIVTMPTGAGKTLIGLRLIHELKRPAMVTVHRKEIADQWVEDMEEILGVDVAKCYGGDMESGDLQVSLYQTIYQDGELRDDEIRMDHDVILCDEAHRVGADTFSRVSLAVNADYRFGFSATPEREDNATLKVIGGTGPLISDISPESLIEQGYLARPEWHILDAPPKNSRKNYRDWQDEYREEIVKNTDRNLLISQKAESLGKPCYVHVERINHGERLEEMIDGASFIHGDSTDRDEELEAFRNGERDILISTLLGEGVDVPAMQSMIMAGGLKTSVGAIQKVGRALRAETDTASLVDFVDNGKWIGDHSEQRIRTYKEYYNEYGP